MGKLVLGKDTIYFDDPQNSWSIPYQKIHRLGVKSPSQLQINNRTVYFEEDVANAFKSKIEKNVLIARNTGGSMERESPWGCLSIFRMLVAWFILMVILGAIAGSPGIIIVTVVLIALYVIWIVNYHRGTT